MRVGMNPNRSKDVAYKPAEITICMLTHLPSVRDEYHEQRMSVVSLSLTSLIKNADKRFELLVWDNGSCPEMLNYLTHLYANGVVNYLVLSRENIGKAEAVARMFEMAPGALVGYSDDDVLFHPKWLSQQYRVLVSFPEVGVVSGAPLTTSFRWGIESNLAHAEKHEMEVVRGHNIDPEWEREFAISIGRDVDRHMGMVAEEEDILLRHNGAEAFATGHHMQYLGERRHLVSTARYIADEHAGAMGGQREFDLELDTRGLMRLSTNPRTTQHIGNVIDDTIMEKVYEFGLAKPPEPEPDLAVA